MDFENRGELRSSLAHSKMVADILRDIAEGALRSGDKLASEVQLREQYGISITSIRRGMETLVRRGILTRQRGSGTFVADKPTGVGGSIVRKDTIGIYEVWRHHAYHPYFTEKMRGLKGGLQQYGWRLWDVAGESFVQQKMLETGRVSQHVDPVEFALEVEQRGGLAGMVTHESYNQALRARLGAEFECVNMGHNEHFPYADYNWRGETIRLLEEVLRRGGQRIAVLGSFAFEQMEGMLSTAAERVEGLRCDEVDAYLFPTLPGGRMGSEYTHAAFVKTRELLEGQEPLPDVIVGLSDCEVSGILDALRLVSEKRRSDILLAGFINKTTAICPDVPMLVLMTDGYAHGLALADLLHQRLTAPLNAPRRITLSCSLLEFGACRLGEPASKR